MATDSLGTLTVDLIANTGSFERGMDKAERSLKSATKEAKYQGDQLDKLAGQIDPVVGAYNRLDKMEEQLRKHRQANRLDDSSFQGLLKQLNAQRDALAANDSAYRANAISIKQMQAATRGLPAQFTDIATSLAAGQNPLTVFLQQGGQIKDQFGGAGAALAGTARYLLALANPVTIAGAALAGLALTYYDAEKTQSEFDQALLAGNKTIGATTGQLVALSSQIGATVGDFSDAEDAVTALAKAGDLSFSQVANLGEAAAAVAQYTGKSAADIATAFAGLGKNATDAAQKASEQYRLITAEQYDLIKALDDQGEHQKALDVLGESLNKNAMARLKQYKESLTGVKQLWNNIAEAAASAYNFGRSKFMPQTNAELLTQTKSQLEFLQRFPGQEVSVPGESRTVTGQEGLQYLQQRIKLLDTQVKSEGDMAQAQADANQAQQDYIRLSGTIDTALSDGSPEKRKAKALSDLKDQYLGLMKASSITGQSSPLLAGVEYNGQEFSGGSYAERVKQINDQFDKKTTAKPKAYQEDAGAKMLDNLRQQYAAIQAQNVALDDQDKVSQKLGAQAQALARWEEELSQLKEKKTLTADQQQLLASSDLITAQLKRNAALEKEVSLRKQSLEDAQKLSAFQETLKSQIDQAQQRNGLSLATFGMGDKEASRLQEMASIQQSYLRQQKSLNEQYNTGRITPELYDQETKAIQASLNQQLQDQQQYYKQLDDLQQDWSKGADEAWANYADAASNYSAQAADAIEAVLNTASSSVTQNFMEILQGTESFADGAMSIIADLSNAIVQALIEIAAKALVVKTITGIAGFFGGGAAGAAGAASASDGGGGIADLGELLPGFASGGFTGYTGVNDVAGLVHGKEFVFDAAATARIGVDNLEALRSDRSFAKLPATMDASVPSTTNNSSRSTTVNYYEAAGNGGGQKTSTARAARRIAQAVDAAQRYN
ncbi:phage tail tape measure protein, lambda family [Pseudomonas citronellolis]|uniref:Phage tail tape measure protein, lambda family n=1 Tax=Pseudomonas citronellolis TaxID=53408 RepID=A0AAQ1KEX1_9PSED|nr:phage tail tape measure protein [Pseudomonas citronellolis]TGC24224.1 phage tail tape measure protein [Pseudomonas citronellolis]SFC50322.1 phage tail tape measure protein, lambda family [Pseudomonas citronellolis]